MGDLLRFHSNFEGRDLMGEVTHRCIVKGENPYNWYKGLELITGAMDNLVNWGDRVAILSSSCPETILRPIVHDTKSHDLLLAMTRLSRKVKGKIIISNNRELLDKYTPKQPGVGVDWDSVPVTPALQSWQVAIRAVKEWGNCKWQQRWAGLSTCSQTKIWFPILRERVSPIIRRLGRADLSRFIHFTTGHNHLLRHRSLLGKEGGIDAAFVGRKGRTPFTSGKHVRVHAT